MLGRIQETPRWADDPVWRRDGQCWRTGQEADSPSQVIQTVGGVKMGDRNNIFVTIINIA